MSIKINVTSSSNAVNVKSRPQSDLNVTVASGAIVPRVLNDLLDVNIPSSQDKYVIMYDSTTQKYIAVNPDEVLSAATIEPIQPGLPADFKNQLDIDLDDRIDLDAGTF